MKRILIAVLAIALILCLASCQVQDTTDGTTQGLQVDYRRFCDPDSLEMDVYNRRDHPVTAQITFGKSLTIAHTYYGLPDDGIPWKVKTNTWQPSVNTAFFELDGTHILTFTESLVSCASP